MKKTKGNYRLLEKMDKATKNEEIGILWGLCASSAPESMPVFVKGVKIMRLNGTPEPNMGTVTFFDIKNLAIAHVRMFGFDKNKLELEAKDLLRFVLELKQKFKLKTELISLKYELQKQPIQWEMINYDIFNDRRYEIINDEMTETFNYLNGALELSSPESDEIFTVDAQRGGYYVETRGQPHTRWFVSNDEAFSKLSAEQLADFNKHVAKNAGESE